MKYGKEIVDRICKHLKGGATVQSTCAIVGISKETFYQWKKTKPDYSDVIKKAMAVPDRKVEDALRKSAIMGHSFEEIEYKAVAVGDKVKLIPIKKITKVVPPNVTAQIFWLKNRCPDEFKDRQETELSGEVKVKIERVVTDERPKE